MPTTYVSKMLGHRNLSTTTRYLNATAEHLHKVIEQIEESRWKAAGPAESLPGWTRPQPDSHPSADGDPAHKSLVS